jgi:hypothetical protein
LVLCVILPFTALADSAGYKVTYDGGSPTAKVGASLYLYIDSGLIRFAEQKGGVVATIPAAYVTDISHGQDVHRRVGTSIGLAVVSLGIGALMLLSKSKKHFVGITCGDGDKKGGFVMQCDKAVMRDCWRSRGTNVVCRCGFPSEFMAHDQVLFRHGLEEVKAVQVG